MKKADFNNKLKNVTKKINKQLKNVKALSTKDLINKFSILKGAKYFSSGIFQNYLVFIAAKKYTKFFSGTTQIDSWKSSGVAVK